MDCCMYRHFKCVGEHYNNDQTLYLPVNRDTHRSQDKHWSRNLPKCMHMFGQLVKGYSINFFCSSVHDHCMSIDHIVLHAHELLMQPDFLSLQHTLQLSRFQRDSPDFWFKFTAVLIFLCFVPLFTVYIFVHQYVYKFGYFHRILKNVLILDQKSRYFKDFVPLLVLDRLLQLLALISLLDLIIALAVISLKFKVDLYINEPFIFKFSYIQIKAAGHYIIPQQS